MLVDKALSSDKPNGHWLEADWLHCKRYTLSSNRKVDGSRLTQVALKHVIHDMDSQQQGHSDGDIMINNYERFTPHNNNSASGYFMQH